MTEAPRLLRFGSESFHDKVQKVGIMLKIQWYLLMGTKSTNMGTSLRAKKLMVGKKQSIDFL